MSICTRCGKQRVIVSSYTEKVEKTTLVYTNTVCPDPLCQKMVEKNLKSEAVKRKIMRDEQEKRALLRIKDKKNKSI